MTSCEANGWESDEQCGKDEDSEKSDDTMSNDTSSEAH